MSLSFDYSQVVKAKSEVNVSRFNRQQSKRRIREIVADMQRATPPRLVKRSK